MGRVQTICSHFQSPKGLSKKWVKSAKPAMEYLLDNLETEHHTFSVATHVVDIESMDDIDHRLAWLIELTVLVLNVRAIWYTNNWNTVFYNSVLIIGSPANVKIANKVITYHIEYSTALKEYWIEKVSKDKRSKRRKGKKSVYEDDARVISRNKFKAAERELREYCIQLLEDIEISPDYSKIDEYIMYHIGMDYKRVTNTKKIRLSQARAPLDTYKFKRLVNGGLKRHIKQAKR